VRTEILTHLTKCHSERSDARFAEQIAWRTLPGTARDLPSKSGRCAPGVAPRRDRAVQVRISDFRDSDPSLRSGIHD